MRSPCAVADPASSDAALIVVAAMEQIDDTFLTGTNSMAHVGLDNVPSESRFRLIGAMSVVMLAVKLRVVLAARRLLSVRVSH